MKDGMNVGRSNDCHHKKEKMVKRNNIRQRRKIKVKTT
jgi:hypothetical protein